MHQQQNVVVNYGVAIGHQSRRRLGRFQAAVATTIQ